RALGVGTKLLIEFFWTQGPQAYLYYHHWQGEITAAFKLSAAEYEQYRKTYPGLKQDDVMFEITHFPPSLRGQPAVNHFLRFAISDLKQDEVRFEITHFPRRPSDKPAVERLPRLAIK